MIKAPRHVRGEMNKLEKDFSEVLVLAKHAGLIDEIHFERITFELAPGCRYTPDFIVVYAGTREMVAYETKGFMRDDALVKLKVFQERYGFATGLVTRVAKRDGGGWQIKWIQTGETKAVASGTFQNVLY